jgi:hypothetical protein
MQTRRLAALQRRSDAASAENLELEAKYREVAQSIAAESARFGLLFPADQRAAMRMMVNAIDGVATAIEAKERVREALGSLAESVEHFSSTSRKFLVGFSE